MSNAGSADTAMTGRSPVYAQIGPVIPDDATLLRYGAAVGIVLVIFAIRAALAPLLGVHAPLLPFLLGVLICAYVAGRGPALLASLITPILATLWFTRWPEDAPPLQWIAHVALFLLLAVITAVIMDALQSSMERARDSTREAEEAVAALREQDRRKDEFLAMLAHELRNPLTPIRNVAHILGRASPDEGTVKKAAQMIERQAGHLTRLVDDLLDVARITHRRIELQSDVVSLEEIISLAMETVQPALEARQQLVTITVTSVHVYVEGDVTRLSQVVGNLLGNASKFSPEGRRIHVNVGGDATQAILTVRDEGVGIDAQLLPKLFDLFLQGDRTLDRAQGGLGIGLTIVKNLVEMHGGTVEAASAGLGKGSEFRIRLPRVPRPDARQRSPDPHERTSRRRRVLVVDDNHDCAESLRDLLRTEGHDVRVVHDGTSALTTLDEFAADVVLLDVGLPHMDGYMVAHAIRARQPPGRRRPRLVALTGYGRGEDKQAALRSGFDDHLVKPVEPERLLQLISDEVRTAAVRERGSGAR
jgi:signal transduction histidine kinase/ActR/RegA family two-component response regulator